MQTVVDDSSAWSMQPVTKGRVMQYVKEECHAMASAIQCKMKRGHSDAHALNCMKEENGMWRSGISKREVDATKGQGKFNGTNLLTKNHTQQAT